MKCNYNLIYKGVPMGDGQHKVQEEYEDLSKRTQQDYKGLPKPKG